MFGFGKKKTSAIYSEVDNQRSVVYDFQLRISHEAGFESYRPVSYRLFHKLSEEEMLPLLDQALEALYAGADAGNGNMLDSLILGAAREAVPDLERQHCDHGDMLRRLINRRNADHDDIKKLLEARAAERDAIREEYEKVCKAMENCGEVF